MPGMRLSCFRFTGYKVSHRLLSKEMIFKCFRVGGVTNLGGTYRNHKVGVQFIQA